MACWPGLLVFCNCRHPCRVRDTQVHVVRLPFASSSSCPERRSPLGLPADIVLVEMSSAHCHCLGGGGVAVVGARPDLKGGGGAVATLVYCLRTTEEGRKEERQAKERKFQVPQTTQILTLTLNVRTTSSRKGATNQVTPPWHICSVFARSLAYIQLHRVVLAMANFFNSFFFKKDAWDCSAVCEHIHKASFSVIE